MTRNSRIGGAVVLVAALLWAGSGTVVAQDARRGAASTVVRHAPDPREPRRPPEGLGRGSASASPRVNDNRKLPTSDN